MSNEDLKPQPPVEDDEIDLIALVKTFWKGRVILIRSLIVFGVIGLFVALFSPKEYTARSVMVPQLGEGQSKFGGLSSLAAMAGFNIGPGISGADLSPTVYPQIVKSVPFQLELMNTPLNFKESTCPVTLFDYYIKINKPSILTIVKKYTIGLPGVLVSAVKGKASDKTTTALDMKYPLRLNKDQLKVGKILAKLLSLETNPKEGYLTLTAKLPEPGASAQLAQRAQELLQQYIIEFKIKKTKANLDFIQQRYDETEKKFEIAQGKLAQFRDRNKNVTSATYRTEEERLTSQYNLIYDVFSELAKQLEQAKIQVKQDTPVFTIVEPVSVPLERSKPKRMMILFIWLFLGGVAGTGIIFGREYLTTVKKRWKEI